MQTRRRGAGMWAVLVALAIALILVSVVLLVTGGRGTATPERPALSDDEIPDITQPVGAVPDMREQQPIGRTTNARLTLKDRNDPSRIAWIVESTASEPIAGTDRYELSSPRAQYNLDDSSVVLIEADRASFVMPDVTGEPESGRFEGGVVLRQLGAEDDADPAVSLATDWIEFDAVAGEITTTAAVRIEGERVVADTQGFRAVLNEVDQRLEFFEAPGGLTAVITPAQQPRSAEASTEPASANAPPRNENRTADAGTAERPRGGTARDSGGSSPAIQYYAATLSDDVIVSQPARRIRSDRARAWIKLENNSIAGEGFSSRPAGRLLPIEASLLAMAVAVQPERPDEADLGFDEPIELRCSGPVTVIPMSSAPAPLGSGDDLALRFEVESGNRVEFEDDELEAIGDADELEYLFTSKLLTLRGSAERPARTRVVGSGTLVAELVTLGLATGIGQAKGPGRLDGQDESSTVAWQEQADVVFRVRDGWMTGSLEQAIASGGVELIDGASRVTAQDLNARFSEAGDRSLIERAILAGDVKATADQGMLEADRVDVRFEREDSGARPRFVVATGAVRAEQDGQRVWAEQMEADLVRSDAGQTEVAFARARESVRYEREDGTYAVGDSASIAAANKTAVIEGVPGVVASGGATVEAERIELDELAASIATPSRGRLTMTGDDGRETVMATWTEFMRYGDSTGELETAGDVELVSSSSPLVRDSFRGDRLVAVVEAVESTADSQGGPGGDRRLVSAVATGTGDTPASAEFLRFAAPGDDQPVRVTAIVGETIEADNAAGVLRVPGAGRLVSSDQRGETDAGSRLGSTLFDWEGSMELDRPAGTATMLRGVRLVHRPIGTDNGRGVVELESERLDARFESGGAVRLTDPNGGDDLRAVTANGAVWARSGEQQMLCDSMDYDPRSGLSRATAAGGGWVTLFSTTQSAPITAAELEWNVETGRIEVVRPSPVSVPR
ncbi:MAG: hypothetical protein AAF937_00365 [Planctomycetota bacterium]